MKLHFNKFIILALTAFVGLSACNSSTDDDYEYTASESATSTLLTAFSLKANRKILANLDSVFFSIDQVNSVIFNADSLPWGTDTRKLTINVTAPDASNVEVVMPSLADGSSQTVSVNDSINFTGKNGVWLRVTSADGSRENIYVVKVNVHQCKADSLQWSTQQRPLPAGNLRGLLEQQTVEMDGRFYCVARTSLGSYLLTSDTPDPENWVSTQLTSLPSDVKFNSLTAAGSSLYLLTESGSLLSSADGIDWTEAATGWSHLYGAYGNDIIGLTGNNWISYPGGNTGTIPAGMPVEGTSRMWTFTNEWALHPQAMFAGGIKANGSYDGNAWGFDGTSWAQLSGHLQIRQLPAARDMIVFPYFTFRTNSTNFVVSRQSAWIAFGGQLADGKMNKTVYVSLDNGLNWNEAATDLQLPADFEPRRAASVILHEQTFHSPASRAIKPITEWDAPFIYLYGGYDNFGTIINETRIGVINRMTFKPLQ